MQDTPGPQEPANLRFLRLLVTVLTGVMILGLLVIIGLFVMRFAATPQPGAGVAATALPESIALPEGARAAGFARGGDWFAVVTEDDRILIYDAASGALRQTVTLEPGAAPAK